MTREIRYWIRSLLRKFRRFERRELHELHRWIERTDNLIHVSILLFVPLLIGLVTFLSNTVQQISFLLFPPLAAGTYTLFADPEGRYASPWKFVAGLTVGALSGWFALELTGVVPPVPETVILPSSTVEVSASGATLSVFLTGAITWLFDLEEPAAFSTALLVLVTGTSQLAYVVSVAASSAIVAVAFVVWRREFYERRADFLYGTVQSDDHVLVPMRGDQPGMTGVFAARLAGAHEAGKVVLLGTPSVDSGTAEHEADGVATEAGNGDVEQAAAVLESHANRIRDAIGVPCEVVIATVENPDNSQYVLETARETNCDLIVTPYEEHDGRLTPFIRKLFRSNVDVVTVRLSGDRPNWKRVLVPVRRPGDVAHAMVDFALRLAGLDGVVATCHCISSEDNRRQAESILADLVETFEGPIETRVAKTPIEEFLAETSGNYDLTVIGASTDRTTASRFISPPTFQRIREINSDVAIVHRG